MRIVDRLHSVEPHTPRLSVAVAREVVIALGAVVVYFGVRGITEGQIELARDNAARVIDLESWLGVFREEKLQELFLVNHGMVTLFNWIYVWGHWPVIGITALWLVLTQPNHYRLIRNGFLVSGAIGLVIFATFPVAPPRLLDIGIVDTVTEHSRSYRVLQPPAFVNQYAAMPSLHFGWNLLIGIALFTYGRSRIVKSMGILSPIAMGSAVVLTGNHFILDAAAGGGLALFGLYIAWHIHPEPDIPFVRGSARA